MPRLIATHEVDDVAHWTTSPKRGEVFGSVATDTCTFLIRADPTTLASAWRWPI
jgi:hypothetical protein